MIVEKLDILSVKNLVEVLLKKVETLEAENAQLRAENAALREQLNKKSIFCS